MYRSIAGNYTLTVPWGEGQHKTVRFREGLLELDREARRLGVSKDQLAKRLEQCRSFEVRFFKVESDTKAGGQGKTK